MTLGPICTQIDDGGYANSRIGYDTMAAAYLITTLQGGYVKMGTLGNLESLGKMGGLGKIGRMGNLGNLGKKNFSDFVKKVPLVGG